jgi:hypothetical protein
MEEDDMVYTVLPLAYGGNMDEECIGLCDAINRIPGLRTIESCCGHARRKFNIWFMVDDPKNLPILLYYCDRCHIGFNWSCIVYTDCAMSPVRYRLTSESVGAEAYEEAQKIADKITEYQDAVHANMS